MGVDLGDQPEVGLDDSTQLLLHLVEARAERTLEVSQGDGRRLRAHPLGPAVSR